MSIRIMTGDCRELLKQLPDQSVHCVVTSPPYFGLRDYDMDGQLGLEDSPEAYIAGIVAVFDELHRVLRDDGVAWLNLGDAYAGSGRGGNMGKKSTLHGGKKCQEQSRKAVHKIQSQRRDRAPVPRSARRHDGFKPKDLMMLPARTALALHAAGWRLRQEIIWHKPNPLPENVRDRCTKSHEYIYLLSKSGRYYFDSAAIGEPATSSRSGNKKRRTAQERGCPADTGKNQAGSVPWEGDTRRMRSVWTMVPSKFKDGHHATFPPELAKRCILAGCPAGGVVLDPFAGAGTAGLVADRLQRDAILMELNPKYVAMTEKRLRDDAPLLAEVCA